MRFGAAENLVADSYGICNNDDGRACEGSAVIFFMHRETKIRRQRGESGFYVMSGKLV